MKKIISRSVEQTHELAHNFISDVKGHIISLDGDLGSGKTAFAQGILKACGAKAPYTSPTFTIMKEYEINARNFTRIYHIDAYRINKDDMIELGWYDIVSNDRVLIIIEWPQNIAGILPHDLNKIMCTWISESERAYTFI
jgi:tRNA threonylcarbamoyladenosine biosynthesis protein TsaE